MTAARAHCCLFSSAHGPKATANGIGRRKWRHFLILLVLTFGCPVGNRAGFAQPVAGQSASTLPRSASSQEDNTESRRRPPRLDVLSKAEWRRIDESVDRGLAWLATQQQPDGSFPTRASGQPGVTSLCIMAFLSRGHLPDHGPYGQALNRAIDYVIDCQRADGLLSYQEPTMASDSWLQATHAAMYNHCIAGLMLGEVYGQTDGPRAEKIRPVILAALKLAREMQSRPKTYAEDAGGVRYLKVIPPASRQGGDADVSVTGWYVMFLRSAKNAGFEVPQKLVDDALEFVRRCYDTGTGGFHYSLVPPRTYYTRGATGAGVLSLFLSGTYDATIERGAGQWILNHPFRPYGNTINSSDHYLYAVYYCSQAMFQLGGQYWEQFYPDTAAVLLENQGPEGSWTPEARDLVFGNAYGTALVVLTLTPPYQLLPIYQR
jgi:hypothetical protein